MGFEIQTQRINGNSTATFTFDDTVAALVYGLQSVYLYAPYAIPRPTIGLRLDVEPNSGVGFNTVVIRQTMLNDTLDMDTSYSDVTILAWVGGSCPSTLLMTNASAIPF